MPPREDFSYVSRAIFSCHKYALPFDSARGNPTLPDGQSNLLDHSPR